MDAAPVIVADGLGRRFGGMGGAGMGMGGGMRVPARVWPSCVVHALVVMPSSVRLAAIWVGEPMVSISSKMRRTTAASVSLMTSSSPASRNRGNSENWRCSIEGFTTIIRERPRERGSWAISSRGSSYEKSVRFIRIRGMLTARVITCSDAASHGEREDVSGPAVMELLVANGYVVDETVIVPDVVAAIAQEIERATDAGIRLVVTTGGTGLSPRDVTPEATMTVCDRIVPGFGELMRLRSLERTSMASLSRAQAATRGSALVVNLPGSPKGAVENLGAVLHLIPHALELLAGGKVEH